MVLNSLYVSLWIGLSGTVIMYNKWILAFYGFPYPVTLTMWHMLFSSALAFLCVRTGYVPSVNMTADTYFRAVVPIGALFAGARAHLLLPSICTESLAQVACLWLSAPVSIEGKGTC